ncbi:transporter substrate-binding domain-containing protein [Mesorhizobium sp.]|uniref:transporter substrate-binding domain-containing protein n=1 Tax=Mesorhizobium sp. TaxID=1871066 RepID=UPI0025BD1CDC|nr:transporter substrate-binding domain-containing protein [Mesorhizobium sp.]
MTYANDPAFPPLEYLEDGEVVGLDIDIGNALARELGLEAVVFKVAFDGLILAVQGGRVDLINSGSYIAWGDIQPGES